MATLHVRNVPERLYRRIQKLAEEENRSLTAEVVQILTRGLQEVETRKNASDVLERIRKRAKKTDLPRGWADSVELIREARDR